MVKITVILQISVSGVLLRERYRYRTHAGTQDLGLWTYRALARENSTQNGQARSRDRQARAATNPRKASKTKSICNPLCTGNADIFFCRPRREGRGLQTLARFRISGGGGGHFSGEVLDEY